MLLLINVSVIFALFIYNTVQKHPQSLIQFFFLMKFLSNFKFNVTKYLLHNPGNLDFCRTFIPVLAAQISTSAWAYYVIYFNFTHFQNEHAIEWTLSVKGYHN